MLVTPSSAHVSVADYPFEELPTVTHHHQPVHGMMAFPVASGRLHPRVITRPALHLFSEQPTRIFHWPGVAPSSVCSTDLDGGGVEPPTHCLIGSCSNQLSYPSEFLPISLGRARMACFVTITYTLDCVRENVRHPLRVLRRVYELPHRVYSRQSMGKVGIKPTINLMTSLFVFHHYFSASPMSPAHTRGIAVR